MTLSRVFQSSWWMNSTEALILSGYFRFGETVMCYGQTVVKASQTAAGPLFDASPHVRRNGRGLLLPFDVTKRARPAGLGMSGWGPSGL